MEHPTDSRILVAPTAYWPSVAYMAALAQAGGGRIEAWESFQKQTSRNRAHILTANGVLRLTVPVKHAGKSPIHAVEIDGREPWARQHWRAIQAAYRHAPYFEHFEPYFEQALFAGDTHLLALNRRIMALCLRLAGLSVPLSETEGYAHVLPPECLDARQALSEKRPEPIGMPAYQQVFGTAFVPNLSVLDLLCCEGPQAGRLLRQARWQAP
jgi:hypothetical protein